MGDNHQPEEAKPEPKFDIHLHINLEQTGQISVEGCIGNELIALGLLEKATDIIKQHNKPLIQQGGMFRRLSGRK